MCGDSMRYMSKLTGKAIKTRFGRYMAIFLIVFLSVAFFAGLKVTKTAMTNTCDDFLEAQQMHDYRLISTLGFEDEDVEAFAALEGVAAAEGGKGQDVLLLGDSIDAPYRVIAMPQTMDLPSLKYGSLPTKPHECLMDAHRMSEKDIGSTVRIVSEAEGLSVQEFTITGLVESPVYLGTERGSTSLGNGRLEGYLYVMPEVFSDAVYTELWLRLEERECAYSDEYEALIEAHKPQIEALLSEQATLRYEGLLKDYGIPAEMAARFGLEEPDTYVLTRQENAGYVSFENDTSIISGIANIFPFFFVLIALLVCVTTMTRMVEEDRSQIGTLKALGYGNGVISMRYILYAASAALPGWLIGFVLGTWGLPKVFWFAYSSLYDFAPLKYYLSMSILLGTLLVVLVGVLGSAWVSCRQILSGKPAELIRPKAPRSGGRILLERIRPIWERIPFLQKISIRNMFRYKSRLFLMLIGIGCSCALVVTAFGVRDSMVRIGTEQFTQIQTYHMEAAYAEKNNDTAALVLDEEADIAEWIPVYSHDATLKNDANLSVSTRLLAADTLKGYWSLGANGSPSEMPKEGEILICRKLAQVLNAAQGETVTVELNGETLALRVSGIFDNYLNKVAVISPDTLRNAGLSTASNCALIHLSKGATDTAAKLSKVETITGITELAPLQATADKALDCLNYIIWLIVLFSGALAFTVIFNLTGINLAERRREVATVQVLGFYPKETESYVLRENLLLSGLAAVIGLPLGTLLHSVVMNMIVIDMMAFRQLITPGSYLASFACTILFALIVNIVMKRQIDRINMAEALKAVE